MHQLDNLERLGQLADLGPGFEDRAVPLEDGTVQAPIFGDPDHGRRRPLPAHVQPDPDRSPASIVKSSPQAAHAP